MFGVDRSGLVRKGFMNACLEQSLFDFNAKYIEMALTVWWYDFSPKALKNEYKNFFKVISKGDSINSIELSNIEKGDIAILEKDNNLFLYLGNQEWIGIKKSDQKVSINHSPNSHSDFNNKVTILRWSYF